MLMVVIGFGSNDLVLMVMNLFDGCGFCEEDVFGGCYLRNLFKGSMLCRIEQLTLYLNVAFCILRTPFPIAARACFN